MTKQKVWFEKKPEFRDECPFFVYGEHLHYCRLKEVNIFDDKDKCTYCPLQSIKIHDRELVKEVCDSIRGVCRLNFRTYKKHLPEDCEKYKEVNAFNKAILGVLEFIDEIQKEYEK